MFSCEYCEISKNAYYKEHLRTQMIIQVIIAKVMKICIMKAKTLWTDDMYNESWDIMNSYIQALANQILNNVMFVCKYTSTLKKFVRLD